jgi:ribosome maturation protein SDO1
MTEQGFDREKIHLNVARYKKGSEKFEVVIEPEKAMAFKKGIIKDVKDVLVNQQHVFSDAKKGVLASEHRMQQIFGASDVLSVSAKIITEGEIQLTAEYRKRVVDDKKKKIIDIIHRTGVDPRTHSPHPLTRIESAFEEAKIRIDEHRSAEEQVNDIIKKLRPVLPISSEVKEIEIRIPVEFAAKSYSIIKAQSRILKEEWKNDGSWFGVIEIPAGIEPDFFDKLNSIAHGNIEAKIIKTK